MNDIILLGKNIGEALGRLVIRLEAKEIASMLDTFAELLLTIIYG